MENEEFQEGVDWGRVLCVIILIVLSLVMIFGLSR